MNTALEALLVRLRNERSEEPLSKPVMKVQECQKARADVASTREKKVTGLKPDLLAEYQRILQRRGTALSEAKDGACTMCHVKLRAQVYVDVKRNDTIITCSSCSRILFFNAPPPQGALEAPLPS